MLIVTSVGGSVASSRTFDVTITCTDGTDYQFNNINREEQAPLQTFFNLKNLTIKNDLADESATLLQAALEDDDMDDDDDVVRADRGSADEDEESGSYHLVTSCIG